MRTHDKKHRVRSNVLIRRKDSGFGLISAIFLLVILAGLGAAIMNISTSQHVTSALDVQGARAYQGARTGIEWGLYQRFRVGGVYCNPGPTTNSFTLPAGSTLSSFTVTVTCTRTAGAVATLDRYEITSTACNQPTGGGACPNFAGAGSTYVQRVVQVEF